MINTNRIKESFSKQGLMKTLGASIESVEWGKVTITAPFHESLTQQHGYFHAGVLTSIVDSACGYAALSALSDDYEVLTVEFKINFLKPAKADRLIAIGQVIQSGKTLTVCEGTVYNETKEKVIAKMTATIIAIKSDK
jgi:uncharacterized protein (TIGR00369 family)